MSSQQALDAVLSVRAELFENSADGFDGRDADTDGALTARDGAL
jgi:hypothetical protein